MKHAFSGIKVIELGGYIVGALCASLLADLGAEVIKVESLQGEGLRGLLGGFQGWNRGKRGIALDLYTEEGRAILHKMVKNSDVLVQNLRAGVGERWSADYDTLSRVNPGLIYCSMPGYGQSGPYIKKAAFDPLLQARSGAMAAQGGPGPPVYFGVAINDYAGAMLGAYGVAVALFVRARTGKGKFLHTALLNASIAVQSGEFITYAGKSETDLPMDELGIDATYRLYRTRDGWLFLGCTEEESWPVLCRVVSREDLLNESAFGSAAGRKDRARELASILEEVFAGNTAQYWLEQLEKAGVPCAPVNYCRDLFEHPQLLENGLVAEHESVELGLVKQMGMMIKLSRTPGKLWRAAPGLGQHTDEVLSELGYSAVEIHKLREKKVVA